MLKLDQARRLKQLEQENSRLRRAISDLTLEKLILKEAASEKFLSAARRWAAVDHATAVPDVPEHMACRVLGQNRSTLRKRHRTAEDVRATPPSSRGSSDPGCS